MAIVPDPVWLQYVVLHHTGVPEPHFDFMLERSPNANLQTWRCGNWPLRGGDTLVALPDHRRAYLDYEGPVSGNRGNVRRICRGQLTVSARSTDSIALVIDGIIVQLSRCGAGSDQWTVSLTAKR